MSIYNCAPAPVEQTKEMLGNIPQLPRLVVWVSPVTVADTRMLIIEDKDSPDYKLIITCDGKVAKVQHDFGSREGHYRHQRVRGVIAEWFYRLDIDIEKEIEEFCTTSQLKNIAGTDWITGLLKGAVKRINCRGIHRAVVDIGDAMRRFNLTIIANSHSYHGFDVARSPTIDYYLPSSAIHGFKAMIVAAFEPFSKIIQEYDLNYPQMLASDISEHNALSHTKR